MRTMKALLTASLCVGMGLALTSCSDPAKDVPQATVVTKAPEPAAAPAAAPTETPAPAADATATPAPAAEPAPVPAAPVTYKLDPNSSIMFKGSNMIGVREGGFSKFDGSVVVEGDKYETAKIEISIDMKSTFSDSDVLTKKLLGDKGFFETEQFPTATFKSTSVVKADDGYTVQGVLSLHGVEKEIAFPAKISADGKTLTASAEFAINRHDWKIEYQGEGDYAVRDDVVVLFDITAVAGA